MSLEHIKHLLRSWDVSRVDLSLLQSQTTISKTLFLAHENLREFIMPRKTAKENFKVDFGDTYFVQSNLSSEQLLSFDQWFVENERDFDEFLTNSLLAGDKISLAYDLTNDTIVASCTIRDRKSPAFGAVLTARSQSGMEAEALVLFKRWVLFDADAPEKAQTTPQRG